MRTWKLAHRSALAALAAVVVGAAGCSGTPVRSASATPKKEESCVFFSTVYDWADIDNESLVVYAPNDHNPYLLKLTFPSYDLKFGVRLGFFDRDHDGRLCSFDDIIVPDGTPARISIASMTKLTKEEAQALIAKNHPPKGGAKGETSTTGPAAPEAKPVDKDAG